MDLAGLAEGFLEDAPVKLVEVVGLDPVVAGGAVSKQQYDDAEAAYGQAKADVAAEHADRTVALAPPGVLHVHVMDTLGKSAQQLDVVDALVAEVARVEIDAEAPVLADRGERALHRDDIEGDLGRVDFQREVDIDFIEDVEDRRPARGKVGEALVPIRLRGRREGVDRVPDRRSGKTGDGLDAKLGGGARAILHFLRRTLAHAFLPEKVASNTLRICHYANVNFTGFFVGKIIDSAIIGVITFVCMTVLRLDFADLARRVADSQPLLQELLPEQERAVVADKKLLLMAICVLSQWTLEQVLATYRLTEAEGVKYLAQLDRIGIIELRPGNRYRLKLAKTFRWRPHGAVMDYFREHALLDYFAGGFDGPGEGVLLVHGSISRSLAPAFM